MNGFLLLVGFLIMGALYYLEIDHIWRIITHLPKEKEHGRHRDPRIFIKKFKNISLHFRITK